MGYRSDVRVMTTLEDFEAMQEIAWKLKEEKNLGDDTTAIFPMPGEDPDVFFDHYDAQEGYLCFGLDCVKWYDGYHDVDFFMEVLKVADNEGLAWQFMRVGEEYDDIENRWSNNFFKSDPVAIMGARTEIVY